jgi:lipoprotein signal peptidase
MIAAVLCDLTSKSYIFSQYPIAYRTPVFFGLSWIPVYNTGIAWSLASEYPQGILMLSIFLSGLCLIEFMRSPNSVWGMIVAGGLANTFDRWFFGSVRDFISISVGGYFFPIFNLFLHNFYSFIYAYLRLSLLTSV